MENSVNLRLCGGTFFTLLLEARKPQYGARQHYSGQKDGLTEPETLLGLAKVVVPDWKMPDASMMDTVKGNTTNDKLCKEKGGRTYVPFSDRAAIRAFDGRVRGQYGEALNAMWAFRDTFIDIKDSTKKDESLVRALVELINEDDSIEKRIYCVLIKTGIKYLENYDDENNIKDSLVRLNKSSDEYSYYNECKNYIENSKKNLQKSF